MRIYPFVAACGSGGFTNIFQVHENELIYLKVACREGLVINQFSFRFQK